MKAHLQNFRIPILTSLFLFAFGGNLFSQTNAWINEIHYDNSGADSGETIEVVIENPGTISDYMISLYNGSNGMVYDSHTLDVSDVGTTIGNFTIYTWKPTSTSIQNGSPDGVVLSYDDGSGPIVIHFLSYEGSFSATDGPASGMTSTDIGVSETGSTAVGQSLQLTGTGNGYADFIWAVVPATSTYGNVNNGQTLSGSGNPGPIINNISQTPTAGNVTSSDAVSVSADVTDSDGVASVSLNWGLTSGNLANTIIMALGTGSTYTTNTNIPVQTNGTTVYYEITATDGNVAPATNTSPEQSYTAQDPIPAPSLIISEVADPGDGPDGKFVEIYNNGISVINFEDTPVFLARYANGGASAQSVDLKGTLAPGDFYVVANDSINFPTYYSTTADRESGIVTGNGNDTYTLYVGGDWDSGGTLFDIYGEIGTDGTGEPWEYENSRAVCNNLSASPNTTWIASEWTITTANLADMTPGEAESSTNYVFDGISWAPTNPIGIATVSDDISILTGTAIFTQDISVNDINISAGAALKVEQVLFVDGNIINNGSIVFINNVTKLGQLGEFSGTISGTGNVTVQRYIPARRAFRFVTSAVTTTSSIHANWQEGATSSTDDPAPGYGTHITGSTTGANGFDATATGNPSMYGFDNATGAWGSGIDNTDVNTLTAGHPWYLLVRGDRSTDLTTNTPTPTPTALRATGDLVTGNHTNTNLNQSAGGFSLIGNPYQAIVDMNKVLENSTNLNDTYYYIWDPNLGERGAYALMNLPGGTAVPGDSEANQFLQPGQGAFVTTLNAGPASLLFEEADKSVAQNPTGIFKPSGATASIAGTLFESNAFANGGSSSDGFLVRFSPTGNNAIDFRDAAKPFNLDENVAIVNNVGYFIMEDRAMPTPADVLQFYNNNYRSTDYVFQINLTGLNEVTAYLADAYLGTETQLLPGINQINFSVDQSISGTTDPTRFSIVFKILAVEGVELSGFAVYPNPVIDARFFVSAPGMAGEKALVSLHDLLGRDVLDMETHIGANNQIEMQTGKLQPGVYMLRIKTETGKGFAQKLIIEQ